MEKEFPDRLPVPRQRLQHLGRRALERAPFADTLYGRLGADSLDPVIEIRPDEHRHVNELLTGETEGREGFVQIQDLWRHEAGTAKARQEFGRADRAVSDESSRAEQEGIVVLRPRCPDCAAAGQVGGLRLALAWCLHRRDSKET